MTQGQPVPKATVIVVSFNTREITLTALRSLREQTRDLEHEVIVVDNASSDGSAEAIAEAFPEYELIASDVNLGFGAANNLAAERARGERLLLLNPDTIVLECALEELVAFADRTPHARIWGGRTLFENRSLNPSSCWGAPTLWSTFCLAAGFAGPFQRMRWLNPESLGSWQRDSEREVDIVSGCFLLIDRDLWDRLGGFHPLFFMYGEDADLCLRGARLGARPRISPRATIVHLAGASERVREDKMVRLFIAKAQMFALHWGPVRSRVGVQLLDLWAASRRAAHLVLSLIGRDASSAARGHWKAIWSRRKAWHEAARKVRGESTPQNHEPIDRSV